MKFRTLVVILASFLLISLSGCVTKTTDIIVPGPEVTIDQATEINLKILDLTKITTGDTNEALGFPLEDVDGAKVIEYRYPNKPIIVKVAKFKKLSSTKNFWQNWINYLKGRRQIIVQNEPKEGNGFWEFKTLTSQVLAWQNGLWFTYIEVPLEFKNDVKLSHSVKELVSLHFETLK